MYSRSYYPESQDRINIPENYDGTALLERQDQIIDSGEEVSFTETKEASATPGQAYRETSILDGIGKLPFLSGIFGNGGLFPGINLKMPKIGTEEILILATAAFLIFSKSGDRECGILLLLLLLIN